MSQRQLLRAIQRYLTSVICHCKFQEIEQDGIIKSMIQVRDRGLKFEAKRSVPGTNDYVDVCLILTFYQDGLAVDYFRVRLWEDKPNLEAWLRNALGGSSVLEHYGKDFPAPGATKVSKTAWTIACPANLESLFQAYDRLAEYDGCPKVFS